MGVVELKNLSVFLFRPLLLRDGWTENVDPALTALLVDAIGERLTDLLPVPGAVERDLPCQDRVLLLCPGNLLGMVLFRTNELKVALVALGHGLEEQLADASPVLTVRLNTLEKLNVLLPSKMHVSLFNVGELLF